MNTTKHKTKPMRPLSAEDENYELLFNIVDKLEPAGRRDVVDVAIYLIWRQTGKPAPWRNVIRGGMLYMQFKMQSLGRQKL
jgi:hypothetical protein